MSIRPAKTPEEISMATPAQLAAATASIISDIDTMVEQKAPGFFVEEIETAIKSLAPQWAAHALAAAEKVAAQTTTTGGPSA